MTLFSDPVLVAFWGLETDFGAFMGKSKCFAKA
jgi:membrane-bound lytic murein transglycosylase B